MVSALIRPGQGDADGAADWIDGRPRSGSQAGTTAILFDVDFAEIGEVVDDALPFEPAAAGGKAIEELLAQDEGEERAEDVTADAGIGLVKDARQYRRRDAAVAGGQAAARALWDCRGLHRRRSRHDTTSLWFEGAGGERLGQYGHSKDYRGHLKQVVLGIVLDDADRPIASFLTK